MDTKKLFHLVSEKMRCEFEMAAQYQHNGTRGTSREEALRDFLAKGRLPAKYGLGAGEVVGHVRDTSRQCDIIIYDSINGLSLHYDENNQIYPIDSVYGIIEVKSTLSKTELLDSLNKIKVFKEMSIEGSVTEPIGNGYKIIHHRPKPFGIVFAYSLSGNSMDSLLDNLKDWESKNSPSTWPNYICVLNEGCIYHQNLLETCLDSEAITKESMPLALKFGNDSLFKFYCGLHDMCSRMKLGPVELERYFSPGVKIGRFTVFGRITEAQVTFKGKPPVAARLKESTLEKIINWCANTEKIRYSDLLKKQLGQLPLGTTDSSAGMNTLLYLYNPDNFPGLDEIQKSSSTNSGTHKDHYPTLLNIIDITIDGNLYALAMGSFNDTDWELLE
ncbi:DUF6602 domain-containing protein [Chromobacterium vaccinii]|uniref:DUF6602 domain-containing protein n=1 Tax=Chromobacterium vaccinii TaxID=1108595 RepID=UPI000B33D0AD|nr:DUF6602 domain-containing protein [Chromobacterium vaccinii]